MENKPDDSLSILYGQIMVLNCLIGALISQSDRQRLVSDFEFQTEAGRAMLVPSELPESLYQSFERNCAHMRRRLSEEV